MHNAITKQAAKLGMMTTGMKPNNNSTGGRRGYAAVADRRTIDEIHRKEGVVPGQKGTCPHASAGIAAARKAAQMAKEHHQATASSNSTQATSFETAPPSTSQDARSVAATAASTSMHMNSANPHFDYSGFYAEELDKKHRDKSYR